jgi:hypothetical protein
MTFQKTILIIAILLLLVFFVFIAKEMYSSSYSSWTTTYSDCPDYWDIMDLSGAFVCNNVHGLGQNLGSGLPETQMDFNTDYYTGSDGLCNKYTWAKQYGLQWDGITSGIANPCD